MRITKVLLLVSVLALVVVPSALALRFADASYDPPVGETGKAYSWSFTGAGGCGPALPYQYRILDGTVPAGLHMDSSGLVSGVPSAAGSWSFWVELSDQNPPSAAWCRPSTAQREFTIRIVEGLRIQPNVLTPAGAFLNQPYSFQFRATGGGTLTWSIVTNTTPPPGLTLNSSTGLLSGTPTAAGDFTFKVQATDGVRTDIQTYTLAVVPELKITSPSTPAAEIDRPFQLAVTASGGRPGYTWTLGGALPAGLTQDAATGAISGSPTAAGSYPLKLTVTDSLGLASSVDVKLVVAAKLAFEKRSLAAGKAGRSYDAHLRTLGGVAPRTWKILHAPAGLHLNRRTGELSGTPRHAGTFRFTVQVTDTLGAVAKGTFVLKVVG